MQQLLCNSSFYATTRSVELFMNFEYFFDVGRSCLSVAQMDHRLQLIDIPVVHATLDNVSLKFDRDLTRIYEKVTLV